MSKGKEIFKNSIVIDGCAPLASPYESVPSGYKHYLDGDITMIGATVLPVNTSMSKTIEGIMEFYKIIRKDSNVRQILTVDDIYEAKKNNQLGLMIAFQGCTHIENDLNLIDVYYRLGVRQMMLCYNIKNLLGDGCTEPGNGGLSVFGANAIKRMNELGIVVDLAHTGHRTTMEAMEIMEAEKKPPIFSHGNARAIFDTPRNLMDDQVKKCASLGGLIGVNGYPGFVSAKKKPTINDFIDHIDHYVNLVGIDHVMLGIDYFPGQYGIMSDEDALNGYNAILATGSWTKGAYPEPPYYYPDEIYIPEKLNNLPDALLAKGYSESDIKKILGENYLRVLKEVWK